MSMLEQLGKDLARLKLNINEIPRLEYPPQVVLEVVEQARAQQRFFQSELAKLQPTLTTMQFAPSEIARSIAPTIEAFRHQAQEIHQVARLFQPYQSQIRDAFEQIVRLAAIVIPVFHPDPYWQDFEAVEQYGDRNAAQRLAQGIPWHPKGWVKKALALRAKTEGKGIDALCLEALTESLLCVVAHMRRLVPVKTEADGLLLTSDGTPSIVRPEDLPVELAMEWVRQETARGAELWLFGLPYTPDIILEKHPAEGEEPQLRIFTVAEPRRLSSAKRQGRPLGSTVFTEDLFQRRYINAYLKLYSESFGRPSQLKVAGELGIDERTLRNYLRRYNLWWPPQV
jgi:hypothetical protein